MPPRSPQGRRSWRPLVQPIILNKIRPLMINIFLAIAPIFLLIILGHALRRGNIPSLEFWNLNDKLVYWVLFPPLLFFKMATMELSGQAFGQLAAVVYTGFCVALVFVLVIGWILKFDRPLHTSLIQGGARHNTFIALAVAEALLGNEGLIIASFITALLIPITNLSVVSLMIVTLRGGEPKGVFGVIIKELMRNPILLAVFFGWMVNLAGIENIPVLFDVCQILGAAALPIVLLCVGANIRIRAMASSALPVILSIAGKMIIFPAGIAAASIAFGLDPSSTLVAMIFGSVPTAAGAFSLAKQMGGDAPAMAAIVTVQTALSFLTMPFTIMLMAVFLEVQI